MPSLRETLRALMRFGVLGGEQYGPPSGTVATHGRACTNASDKEHATDTVFARAVVNFMAGVLVMASLDLCVGGDRVHYALVFASGCARGWVRARDAWYRAFCKGK